MDESGVGNLCGVRGVSSALPLGQCGDGLGPGGQSYVIMLTYVHTCSHMFTRVHTCSHMFTHVHTCSRFDHLTSFTRALGPSSGSWRAKPSKQRSHVEPPEISGSAWAGATATTAQSQVYGSDGHTAAVRVTKKLLEISGCRQQLVINCTARFRRSSEASIAQGMWSWILGQLQCSTSGLG